MARRTWLRTAVVNAFRFTWRAAAANYPVRRGQSPVVDSPLNTSEGATPGKLIVMCGPSPDSWGGISSVIQTYLQSGVLQALSVCFVPTYRDGPVWRKLLVHARALGTVVGLLAGRKVKLVHLHTAARTSFLRKSSIALSCWLFRVPYVMHIHSGRFVEYVTDDVGPLQRAFVRFILGRAAHVIALTDSFRRAFEAQLELNCPVSVLPNPTPLPLDAPARAARDDREYRVIYLGVMTETKGFFELLGALSALRAEGLAIRLRCGGSGDLAAIAAECHRLGIDGTFDYLGWVGADRRLQELLAADVLVLPSRSEGQPMVVIEAMTVGTAIVASNVGGIPDTVTHGVEALLVPPGNVSALAEALQRLASDPELRAALGERGRVRARAIHAPDRIRRGLQEIYAAVLTQATSTRSGG